jgi:hypothetical protein
MRLTVILAAVLAVLFASSRADARPKHAPHYRSVPISSDLSGFFGLFEAPQATRSRTRGHRRHIPAAKARAAGFERRQMPSGLARVMAEGAVRVVSHPSGCPSRAFCGCGASVRVFGRSVRSLWLARSWLRFPRSAPAPMKVAVRAHHVFVLQSHISGTVWEVYDANSGHGRTRVHPRSIAGFVIVDPRA